MGISYTSYFGLTRLVDAGPEIKGWVTTDLNFQIISLLLQANASHVHTGATPINYPGYNISAPATPTLIAVTAATPTNGVLSPGTIVGARLSYLDSLGLETAGSPEVAYELGAIPERPDPVGISVPTSTPVPGAIGAGTYIYTITKAMTTGETQVANFSTVDVAAGTTAFDSYTVTLSFDPINSYTDGTDSLKIYRSSGFNSTMQLLKTITDPVIQSYTDTNIFEDATHYPPTTNTFGKNQAAVINWSGLSHPAEASKLRIYVTQTAGSYGVYHLLEEYPVNDPATPLPSSTFYYGSEILSKGWPKETSQTVGGPPKVNLGTQATGAPILTAHMDFNGYWAKNFRFPTGLVASTPMEGAAYVETSTATPTLRVRVGGNYYTMISAGSSYTHAVNEPGGHGTGAIFHSAGPGGPSVLNILNTIATPSASQFRKQVQVGYYATPSASSFSTTSTAAVPLPEMETGFASGLYYPDFAGQYVDITFSGGFFLNPGATTAVTGTTQFEINGSLVEGESTIRSFTALATPSHYPVQVTFSTPISAPLKVRVMWWVSAGGTLISPAKRRTLSIREVF